MRASFLLLLALAAATMPALEIHVAPTGDDQADGSEARPLATLTAARDRARASGRLGKEPVVVRLADGIHFLKEPLRLGPQDGGSAEHPATWRAANEGRAILSGGGTFESFAEQVSDAMAGGASGFMVGRALWGEAARARGDERQRIIDQVVLPRWRTLVDLTQPR